MFVQSRQADILEHLRREPRLAVTEVQRRLGVSRSTLRRDLINLERRGELLRLHGGIVLRGHRGGEPTFERRRRDHVTAKQNIARAAASLVPANATVFIDAGTTCLLAARELMQRDDVRIFTNSVSVLAAATGTSATVAGIGGELRSATQAMVGSLALRWLEQLRFDIALLGASGTDETGLSTTELTEAAVKQAVIDASGKTLLLADAGKWARPATVRFASWDRVDRWVVDRQPDVPTATRRAMNIKLTVGATRRSRRRKRA